jgi:pimeloyl-ACP methyl ester carboxylesterase
MPLQSLRAARTGLVFDAEVTGPREGPLVVLLHGYPQNRHTWRAQLPALAAAGFRCVAPDQRGYSPGARPDPAELWRYAIDELVADALDVVDATRGGERFHLVGHDWGGALAWLAAARHPERVLSLAVLSRPHPSAFRRAIQEDASGQRHRSRHHRAFLDPATGPKLLEDDGRRLREVLAAQGVPADAVALYLSTLLDPQAIEAALAWYRAAANNVGQTANPPPALERIPVPTLYVWGDADATVSPEAARWTAEFVAAPYRFEVLPGVGHFATDQAPERVSELLLAHLAAAPASR